MPGPEVMFTEKRAQTGSEGGQKGTFAIEEYLDSVGADEMCGLRVD
jgi:hypothetical protein